MSDQCQECGMEVDTGEYHPYAACLMFVACKNRGTVRVNLQAILDHGYNEAILHELETSGGGDGS